MSRAPGVNIPLVLPAPTDKYDAADQRETRRLIEQASRALPDWSAVASVPAPITAFGALTGAADNVPYFTGVSSFALASLTPYARTIIACVNAAAARTALGLGSAATHPATDFDAAGAAAAVLATSAQRASNLSDLASVSSARTNLGLGALATLGAVTEAQITLADNTTDNVSITKHGFVPKAPNDTTKFLSGDGTWAVPAGGGGGGTPPSFPVISNWEFGIDAALSLTTSTGGLVTQINDISGNARHATNGAVKPRYLVTAFNLKYPCWVFDGTNNQHLLVTLPNLAAPVTIVMCIQDLSVGTGDGNIYRDQTFRAVGYLQGNNSWAIFGTSTGFATSTLWDQNKASLPQFMSGAPAVRIDVYNNASSLICNNNVEVTGSATCSGTIFGGVLNIGNGGSSVTSAAKFLLRGFHIYSKALSLAERDSIRAYYANTNVAGIVL